MIFAEFGTINNHHLGPKLWEKPLSDLTDFTVMNINQFLEENDFEVRI